CAYVFVMPYYLYCLFFFSMQFLTLSTLFPYTTLFRSIKGRFLRKASIVKSSLCFVFSEGVMLGNLFLLIFLRWLLRSSLSWRRWCGRECLPLVRTVVKLLHSQLFD